MLSLKGFLKCLLASDALGLAQPLGATSHHDLRPGYPLEEAVVRVSNVDTEYPGLEMHEIAAIGTKYEAKPRNLAAYMLLHLRLVRSRCTELR